MSLQFNSIEEVLTGILYRLNQSKTSGDFPDQAGDLEFKVNRSKVSIKEDGEVLLVAEVSAHMQVPAFLIEIDGLVVFEIEGVTVDEMTSSQLRNQEVKEAIQELGSELFQDPVNRLVSQVLVLTPTKPS